MTICKAKTKENKPCKRDAGNYKYCGSHRKNRQTNKKVTSYKVTSYKVTSYRARDAKGWKAPKKGNQRTDMATKCGPNTCFLDPEHLKFPICPVHNGTNISCKPSCKGALSAKLRARMLAKSHPGLYPKVETKADKILRNLNCKSVLK